MKKLITLLAILLFATNLYSSDWKLIESFNYELENVLWVENEILLSSNENSCYLIRDYLEPGSPYCSRIYHSTNKGVKWEASFSFCIRNDDWHSNFYTPSYAFSFSPEHMIIPMDFHYQVGKVSDEISTSGEKLSYLGISSETARTFNRIEMRNFGFNFRVFEMLDKQSGFILGTISNSRNFHTVSITNDNWQSMDTMRLPNNKSFSSYPGIFASYRGENNIVVSSVREEEGKADESFLLGFDIATKSSEEIYSSADLKFENFLFLDEQIGFTVDNSHNNNRARIHKTTDGGRSWFLVYLSNSGQFQFYTSFSHFRFKFYDENNGIIPYLGGVLMTRDGGETWTASPIETEVTTRNITATWVGSSIIADGRDGKLFRYQGDFFDIPLGTAEPALPLCNTFDNKLPVKLEWIPAGMATHYRLQVSKFEDFSELDLFEDDINNNSFAIAELDSGVTYHWRVQPYNSKEEGEWSESCSFTVVYPLSVVDSDSRFSVYPNPTRDILHIRTDELIARAELSDLLGNVVISDLTPTLSKGEGVSLNVEGLPA